MAYTAQQVANYLRMNGFTPGRVSEADEQEDGQVQLAHGVYVQVGESYVIVNVHTIEPQIGDVFWNSPTYPTPVAALPTIRRLVSTPLSEVEDKRAALGWK
ncbi:hypothetical protein AB3X94_37370 [Paraburkholderia sp. BR10923]|uniref:hypothetical protein n=1 Tax=Paraburkholderia sp. BR10923 TaxID=3236992 RepID=UPI0034CDEDC0